MRRSHRTVTTVGWLVGFAWVLVALGSWAIAHAPPRLVSLLYPLGAVTPLWSLVPPSIFLVVLRLVPQWKVVAAGTAPFLMWALPRYVSVAVDPSLVYSRPGVYHAWVTCVATAGTILCLAATLALMSKVNRKGAAAPRRRMQHPGDSVW